MKKENIINFKGLRGEKKKEKGDLRTIIRALEYLKEEAGRCELEDVQTIIDAAFKLCFSIYYFQLRGEYISEEEPPHPK